MPAVLEGLPLRSIRVRVEDLCLWPDNPRLRLIDDDSESLDDEKVASEAVQEKLFREMSQPAFDIPGLVASLASKGFVEVDAIIVRRLGAGPKYIVLEGNRRTTALKTILAKPEDYRPEVVASLREIPVRELVSTGNAEEDEDNADFILGIRHHGGIKEWGPLQRGYSLYKRYLKVSRQTRENFQYDPTAGAETGENFAVPAKTVRKMIRVYRAFEQLRGWGYKVRDDHFSLLEAALSKRALGEPYFEQNENTFLLSNVGMERFEKLCLQEDCSITNPGHFAVFAKIVELGTRADRVLVESGGQDPRDILRVVERRADRNRFRASLMEARTTLEALSVTDFRGTTEERAEIQAIAELVNKRFVSLLQ